MDRRGITPRPVVYEPSILTTELLTLAVAAVKRTRDKAAWLEQGRPEERKCC